MERIKATAQHTGHEPIVRPCGKGERRTADYDYWQGASYPAIVRQCRRELLQMQSPTPVTYFRWKQLREVVAFCE